MTVMANAQKCSQCGADLDPGLPRGLCGQCLISLGLASGLREPSLSIPRAAPTDSSTSPTLGRIGDYELIEEIARGGMGVVYKARQLSLGRIVAVKMILAGQFVDKKVIQRFRAEVTTAALLRHPNIVPVHEVGLHAGQHFFSPEQASPDRGKVGRRSDVYALGAILYPLLTARAPSKAESGPAIVTKVLNSEPVPPRLLNPSVPRDMETICLKCLEKEPTRRYATAKELADELGRFLEDKPVQARPVSRTEKIWRWCRRKPALASSLFL